jgi:hypothetical protein
MPEEKIETIGTNDTTSAALGNHLLRSVLIAQHCAASVHGYYTVKALDCRCAGRADSLWMIIVTYFMTHYPEMTDKQLFPRSRPSNGTL